MVEKITTLAVAEAEAPKIISPIKSEIPSPVKSELVPQQEPKKQQPKQCNGAKKKEIADNSTLVFENPRPADVLCGRGKEAFKHIGNDCFRLLIARYADTYQGAPTKKAKSQLILRIVDIVFSRGGRFLMRSNSMSTYNNKEGREDLGANDNNTSSSSISIESSTEQDGENNSEKSSKKSSNNKDKNSNKNCNAEECDDEEGWIDGGRKMGKKKTGYALRDAVRGRVKCIFEKLPSSMMRGDDILPYNHPEIMSPPNNDNNLLHENSFWHQQPPMISYDDEDESHPQIRRKNYYRCPENFNNSHHITNHAFMMENQQQHQQQQKRIDRKTASILRHSNCNTRKTKIEEEPEKDWRNCKELDNETANDLMVFFSSSNNTSNSSSSHNNCDHYDKKNPRNSIDNSYHHDYQVFDPVWREKEKENNDNRNGEKPCGGRLCRLLCCRSIPITPPPYQYFYPNDYDNYPYNYHLPNPTKNFEKIY